MFENPRNRWGPTVAATVFLIGVVWGVAPPAHADPPECCVVPARGSIRAVDRRARTAASDAGEAADAATKVAAEARRVAEEARRETAYLRGRQDEAAARAAAAPSPAPPAVAPSPAPPKEPPPAPRAPTRPVYTGRKGRLSVLSFMDGGSVIFDGADSGLLRGNIAVQLDWRVSATDKVALGIRLRMRFGARFVTCDDSSVVSPLTGGGVLEAVVRIRDWAVTLGPALDAFQGANVGWRPTLQVSLEAGAEYTPWKGGFFARLFIWAPLWQDNACLCGDQTGLGFGAAIGWRWETLRF